MIPSPIESTRKERLGWAATVALIVCAGLIVIASVDHRYFYLDDTESGAAGNWLQLGRILRDGQFPSLVLDQWMAGNYPVEGQGGLWNPVQMLINYIAPSVDNLAVLSAVVKLGFSIVLAWGVFRVATEYGSHPAWAAVGGACAPFAGFTLYFEQTSWVTSLIGMAWVVQAWASGVRYARGRSGPLPTFAFLYLAISVGYVHAAAMAGVMIACLMIGEALFQRQWQPTLRLAGVGVAAAACGAVTFLPGLLTSDVTWRTAEGGAYNDNFLTAPWSETLTASIPSSVSAIESWAGETTAAPITYIAWFVLPGLAFVAWRAVVPALRELSAPLLLLAFTLLFTAGPSDIGQIRWPARLLPFVAVATLVLVVVLLSRFGTITPLRPRMAAASLITLTLVLRASSSGPQYFGRHLLSGIFILAAGALALYLAHRFGARAVAALLLVTIVPIALFQVVTYSHVWVRGWHLPTTQSAAKGGFADWEGTTLQLGDRELINIDADSTEFPWHSQVYGNYAKNLDLTYVNAYTPVGHRNFAELLCMDYDGSTCDDAYRNVFRIDPYTGRTFADLMLVDRVVLQKKQYPLANSSRPPPGWRWVEVPEVAADEIYVLERNDGPISTQPGRVSATVGTQTVPESETVNSERLSVTSPAGGSVVFARLAWPGYTATLGGDSLQTKGIGGIFLYVDIPPGTRDAELVISFRPPGQRLGLAVMVTGLVLLMSLTVLDIRRRSERTRDNAETPQLAQPIG